MNTESADRPSARGTEPGGVEYEKTLQPAPPSGGPELDGRKDVLSSAGLGQLHAKLLTVTSTGEYPLDENDELMLLRLTEWAIAQHEALAMLLDNAHHYLDGHWCQCASLGEDEECHWHKLFEFSKAVADLSQPLPAPPAVKGV